MSDIIDLWESSEETLNHYIDSVFYQFNLYLAKVQITARHRYINGNIQNVISKTQMNCILRSLGKGGDLLTSVIRIRYVISTSFPKPIVKFQQSLYDL